MVECELFHVGRKKGKTQNGGEIVRTQSRNSIKTAHLQKVQDLEFATLEG